MTRWLIAARQAQQSGTQLTQPTKPQPNEVSSVVSVVSERKMGATATFGVVPDPSNSPPDTTATTTIHAADVAKHQRVNPSWVEASRLGREALKDLEAATDAANALLGQLRGCETPEAVCSFLETYRPAIDALEKHAPVRKIHIHNLAQYKREQFR